MDVKIGEDLIDLSDIDEIDDFAQLLISNQNGKTHIDDLNSDFAIELIGEISLTEEDFIFS